jgi:hypothetical protein
MSAQCPVKPLGLGTAQYTVDINRSLLKLVPTT